MQKAHQFIIRPHAGFFAEELKAIGRKAGHFGTNIIDFKGEVVKTRPPFSQVLLNRPIVSLRRHELQLSVIGPGGEKGGSNVLVGYGFPLIGRSAEEAGDEGVRFVEVGDGDTDVV